MAIKNLLFSTTGVLKTGILNIIKTYRNDGTTVLARPGKPPKLSPSHKPPFLIMSVIDLYTAVNTNCTFIRTWTQNLKHPYTYVTCMHKSDSGSESEFGMASGKTTPEGKS